MNTRSRKLLGAALLASITFLGSAQGAVTNQESGESVVLVHLVYEYGKWSVGPDYVTILPCESPSQVLPGAKGDPLVRVLGKDDKVLHEYQMRNPLRVLYEVEKNDKEAGDRLPNAEEISLKYKFSLASGMQVFQFWEKPQSQKEPDVSVDLRKVIKQYWSLGGTKQEAGCQAPSDFFAPYGDK